MKIQPLSTQTHMDGRVGEFFLVHKTLLLFQRTKVCSYLPTIEANGEQDLNVNKMHNKSMKYLHTAHAN